MKIPVIILLLCLTASRGFSQSWADKILPPDTLTARDNNKMLIKGFLLQTAGIGLCIASVYIWNDVPEDQYGVPLTGFGIGVAATLVGSFWITDKIWCWPCMQVLAELNAVKLLNC
jgi:hypothetical protein